MDFERNNKRTRWNRHVEIDQAYPSSLQFYSTPPNGHISLMDFDEMAVERLKVLRTVERVNLGGKVKNSEDWVNKLYDDFNKNKYFVARTEKVSGNKRDEAEAARRRDHISHFILRLAYCRTEELRRWFISQETDLFKVRFLRNSASSHDNIRLFMTENNLKFDQISQDEIMSERENLVSGTYNIGSSDLLEGRSFFKVPFTEALDLVKSRKVFLKGGFAYVPDTDLVTLVTTSFRAHLSQALAQTNRALPQLDDDERLVRMLQDFDKRYTGNDYTEKKKGQAHVITPAMIDHLATKSFPLCMRTQNDALRTNHHLKHGGRLTYGLFLKAAGLSLEDAMHFWRSHFTKVIDIDKFEKEYAYGIRYNYGKEGKRTNFTPYSCLKIITTSLGPADTHGCPFKHTDASMLKHKLNGYGVSQQAIGEIMDLTSKSHYQIACQRYWEAMHNTTLDSGINHPNQYFEESQKCLNGDMPSSQGRRANPVKTNRTVVYSTQSTQSSQSSTQASTQSTQAVSQNNDDSCFEDMDSDLLAQYMDSQESS